MKHFVSSSLLAATLVVSGMTAAQAATVSVDFNFEGLSGNTAAALNFTDVDTGLMLAVTPHNFADISTIGANATITANYPEVAIGINNNGIGVCEPNTGAAANCKGSDELDGGGSVDKGVRSTTDNELLLFAFDRIVSSITVIWSNNDTNDRISLFEGAALTLTNIFNAIAPSDSSQALAITGPLDVFGLGVQGDSDQVRIAGLRVSFERDVPPPPLPPVPLPAAGWMMLAGLGGLAAMRRRKRA
ncbi:MAG: VPLPA-CTERM sorting domain-containing protein [Paracoccaceae bacterium]